ncbi:MAG: hypothetical protein LQ350_003444 [Teloschistes chrysophthalmus]|nr:MAG: hypothetical protein LQ350_003444 [Niorma chrysophthalma]
MPPTRGPLTIHLLAPPLSPAINSPYLPISTLAFFARSATLSSPAFPLPSYPDIPNLFLAALRVRIIVFKDEQKCSLECEVDDDDRRSWHWVAFEGEEAVGTMRLVPVQEKVHGVEKDGEEGEGEEGKRTQPRKGKTDMWDGREAYIKIGRMATIKEYRGSGIARRLVDGSMAWAAAHGRELEGDGRAGAQWHGLVLSHAQKVVKGWWEKMGFVVDDGLGVWWEEGIEHVGMWRRVYVREGGKGE